MAPQPAEASLDLICDSAHPPPLAPPCEGTADPRQCCVPLQDPPLAAGGMNWETAWLSSSAAPARPVPLCALHEGGAAVPKDTALVRKEGVACE